MSGSDNHIYGLLAALGGAVLTVVGTLPALESGAAPWTVALAVIGAFLIATGLIYQFREYLARKFGPKNILLSDHHTVVRADDDDAKWIHERAQREFGTEVTPLNQINLIRSRYPDAFKIVWYNTRNGRERRGYICAFPIDGACLSDLHGGTFSILGVHPDRIPEKMADAEAFYVGGILADDRRSGVFLLHELRRMIPLFRETRRKIVYTRPVTQEGLRYVRSNDFLPVLADRDGMGDYFHLQF